MKWHGFWWLARIGTNRLRRSQIQNFTCTIWIVVILFISRHDIQIPSNHWTVHHRDQRRRSPACVRKRQNKETFKSSTTMQWTETDPRLRRYEQTHDRFAELYNFLERAPTFPNEWSKVSFNSYWKELFFEQPIFVKCIFFFIGYRSKIQYNDDADNEGNFSFNPGNLRIDSQ